LKSGAGCPVDQIISMSRWHSPAGVGSTESE
jgi:hypothetical protein